MTNILKDPLRAPVDPATLPEGTRWFISRYPELSITVSPAGFFLDKNLNEHSRSAKRLLFIKEVMPRNLRGAGSLTKGGNLDDLDQGDRNASPFWGILKVEDPAVIAFLRKHEYYRTTAQDNRLSSGMRLKELAWDPSELERGEGVAVKGVQAPEIYETPAPEEKPARLPKARVGARKKTAVAA